MTEMRDERISPTIDLFLSVFGDDSVSFSSSENSTFSFSNKILRRVDVDKEYDTSPSS